MRQANIETKSFRTKMAAGYVLIVLLVGGIVHTWLGGWHELETLEAENNRINNFRKEVHEVYVRMAELSLMGETVLEWEVTDAEKYRNKRLDADSLLCSFKRIYPARRIDSVRHLLEDKEKQLYGIMEVLDKQDAINEQIARRVPVIAWKSTQEEPKPTATTSMLYTLNRDMIARQQAQSRQLSEYADSLAARNAQLNHQLQRLIQQMDTKVQSDFRRREQEIGAMRERSFRMVGGITGFVILLLLFSYIVIHRNANRIRRYGRETAGLIARLQKALEQNKLLLSARRKAMFTVIHELRTPLTAINGYAELLPQAESAGKMTAVHTSSTGCRQS